jgi:hypothetical protein
MNYTFIAIGCYILMRGLQVLFEGSKDKSWYKILMKIISIMVLYVAVASVIAFYLNWWLLGFDPHK